MLMSSINCANDGKRICDDLTSSNKGDYLTGLVVNESTSIINDIESLDADIAGVQSAVEAKRREIAAREAQKRAAKKKEEKTSNASKRIDVVA